jgi:predicted nucleic acid-binding protein
VLLFLDANVLFTAAHNLGGRAAALVTLARDGRCDLATSPHAREEARRNLELKYPAAVPRLNELLEVVRLCAEASPEIVEWARAESLPAKDAPILAAAAQCGAGLLVTGDRTHFGHLYGKSPRGVLVVTPAEALRRVLSVKR